MSQAMMNLVTPSGERHGIINRVANSVKDDGFKHMSPETKAKAEKLKKEEARIVKARYINYQGPNERLVKPYMRWAGDTIDYYNLIPDQVYELPMGFINEVNDPSKRKPKRSGLMDAQGRPLPEDGPGEIIHQLIPVNF